MSNRRQCCSAVKTNGSLCTKDRPNGHLTLPFHIRKNCIIIPIEKTLPDPSKIMDRPNKGIENVLCQSKKQFLTPSNAFSKELTIFPIKNKENNVLSKLNKLPDISFDLVKPKPIFKVPKVFSKPVEINPKTIIESEIILNKKVVLKKHYSDVVSQKHSKKENIQRIQNLKTIKIKPKTFISKNAITSKSTKKLLNTSIISHEVRKIISNDLIINETTIKSNALNDTVTKTNVIKNTNIKTNDLTLTNEDYTLMNLSINGQIDIVRSSPLDFFNVNIHKYDNFKTEVITKEVNNMNKKTSQSDMLKSPSGQEIATHLSDNHLFLHFSDYINTF